MRLRRPIRDEAVSPVSFFACQDIMFAAGGVFLLISILLSLFGKISELSFESVEEAGKKQELRAEAQTQARLSRQLALLQTGAAEFWDPESAPAVLPVDLDPWLIDPVILAQENAPLQAQVGDLRRRLTQAAVEMNRHEVRLERLQSGAWETLLEGAQTIVRTGPAHVFREPLFLRLHQGGATLEWIGRPDLDQTFTQTADLWTFFDAHFSPDTQSVLILLHPTGIEVFNPTLAGLRARGYSVGYEPTPDPARSPQE